MRPRSSRMRKNTWIAFLGDFSFPFSDSVLANIDSVRHITGADTIVGNLESSMISQDRRRKLANLHSTLFLRQFILKQGIKIVSLANNHVMDYGKEGLQKLLDFLKKSEIYHCGAGTNLSQATKPLEVRIRNKKWVFVSFAWPLIQSVPARDNRAGVAPLDRDLMVRTIRKLREKNDEICVLCHWGYEYEKFPLPAHRTLAHVLIDTGATVIIGHHPHVIQGVEYYKGRMIAYSLGNFFLPLESYSNSRVRCHRGKHEGLVIKYNANQPKNIELFISKYEPRIHTLRINSSTECFLSELAKLSEPLQFSDKEYIRFFKKNRVRRRLLPVMTGGRLDALNGIWLKARTQGIQVAVRLRNMVNWIPAT